MNKLQLLTATACLHLAACSCNGKDKDAVESDVVTGDTDTDTDLPPTTETGTFPDTDDTDLDTGTGVLLGSVSEAVNAIINHLDVDGCPTDNSTGLADQACVDTAAILVPALEFEIVRIAQEQTGNSNITMADILADQVPGTVWWQNNVTGSTGDFTHTTEIAVAFEDQMAAFAKDGRNPTVTSIQSTSVRVSEDMLTWTPLFDQTKVRSVPEALDDLDVKLQDSRFFDPADQTPSLEVFAVDYDLSDTNFNFSPTLSTMNQIHEARAEATATWTNNASIYDNNGGLNAY